MKFFLDYSDTLGPFIPIIAFFINRKNIPGRTYILLGYLVISSILYGYSNYLADKSINNLFLYHIICFIEFYSVGMYLLCITQGKKGRLFIYSTFAFFFIFFFVNLIFLENIQSLNSNSICIEFLLLIIIAICYFYEQINSDKIIDFYKEGDFWIVAAFIFYFAGAFLSFALYKYTAKSNYNFMLDFWDLQVILYLIKCLLISIGFLCYRKK